MADKQDITEEFLLQCSGCAKLSDITQLSLVDMGLTSIPHTLLSQLTSLQTLDLSGNQLSVLPHNLCLVQVRTLTVEGNKFKDVEFLRSFPALEELYMENNELTAADKLIAVSLCPKLQSINKSRAVAAYKLANNIKAKLKPLILKIWDGKYTETFKQGRSQQEESKCLDLFVEEINKLSAVSVNEGLFKYRDFLVTQFIEKKRASPVNPSPAKKLKPNQDNGAKGRVKKKAAHKLSKKNAKETSDEEMENKEELSDEAIARLAPLPDYEPFLFLRCHSKDNDPGDCDTKVWRAEFEPSTERPGETTSIVATCGGDCLCLIDCNTGKLMKRYRQPGDQFYVVAWTTVKVKSETGSVSANILATAGETGTIYLIHPSQCVCYAQLKKGGHSKEVASLMFHPQEKTLLFSGASDRQIILWDIDTPSFPDYKTNYRVLMKFRSPGGDILNMIFNTENNCLLAGCSGGCFAWNLAEISKVKQASTPDCEVVLSDKSRVVDGLIQITDDIVASKVIEEGTILLWSVGKTLANVKKRRSRAVPIVRLLWKQTEEIYLNLGHFMNSGVLVCGGDDGEIYMYNVKQFLKKSEKSLVHIYEPSQILDWPNCKLSGPEEKDLAISETLQKKDCLIINGLGLNWNQEYMVAGTDNNLVCIWRRADHGD